jgi:hypothetical protein
LRVDFQDLFEGRQGPVEIAELDEDEAAAGQGSEMAGLRFQGRFDVVQRLLEIVQKVVDRGPPIPSLTDSDSS